MISSELLMKVLNFDIGSKSDKFYNCPLLNAFVNLRFTLTPAVKSLRRQETGRTMPLSSTLNFDGNGTLHKVPTGWPATATCGLC